MYDFFDKYKNDLNLAINIIGKKELEFFFQSLMYSYNNNKKVIILGNGGSAATASHFACDLGKGSSLEGLKRFKVISLTDNLPLITAISNDLSYDEVFKYQLENILEEDDLVIGISASGNSENVVSAFEFAKSKSARTFALIGFSGGRLKDLSDKFIHVNSSNYGIVEDIHLMLEHVITQYIRSYLLYLNNLNKDTLGYEGCNV